MDMDDDDIVITVDPDKKDLQNPGCVTLFYSAIINFLSQIFQRDNGPPQQYAEAAEEPTQIHSTVTPPPSPPPEKVPGSSSSSSAEPTTTVVQTVVQHPITRNIREQELGISVFNLGAPITIALLITTDGGGRSHTPLVHCVLTGLSAGCISIWNGLVLRGAFPQIANVFEQLGIVVVLMSFNGFVASALPPEFAWVPMLCGGLCVLPFVIAALPRNAPEENTTDDGI